MRPGRGAVALEIVAFAHCCLFGQTPGKSKTPQLHTSNYNMQRETYIFLAKEV